MSYIKTKYEKYFFGDFLSANFWQKLWEQIKIAMKTFSRNRRRWGLQSQVDSERQVCKELFITILFPSHFLPEICMEKVVEEIFVYISFLVGDLGSGVETIASRLICQYTTYWGTATAWSVIFSDDFVFHALSFPLFLSLSSSLILTCTLSSFIFLSALLSHFYLIFEIFIYIGSAV